MRIEIRQAITGVRNQASRMFFNVWILTVLAPFIIPMPRTLPTTAWELDTGTPIIV